MARTNVPETAPSWRNAAKKIEKGEIWKKGENVYMQLVTYSGHAPFKLPRRIERDSFLSGHSTENE
ncbi:hypothetical protein NIB75_05480 [Bacteroides uniformis]|nr:hypothetical protein [Bacteroides uniformis]